MTSTVKMRIVIISTLFVIVFIIVGMILYQNSKSQDVNGVVYDQAPEIEGQPIKGNLDAKVTITEFGDYKCPSCKAWDNDILPLLERDYIDEGKANLIYVNTPFHGEQSELAALASEYIWDNNTDLFWEYHSNIFNEQPAVESHDDPWISEDKLIEIAETTSNQINQEALRTALKEQVYRDNIVKDVTILNEYEVEMTPTIMINNIKLDDPFNYDVLKQEIDKFLEEE